MSRNRIFIESAPELGLLYDRYKELTNKDKKYLIEKRY